MESSFYKVIKPNTALEVFGLHRAFTYTVLVVVQSSGRSLLSESSGEGFGESYRTNTKTQSVKIKKKVLKEHQVHLFDWDDESYY